MSESNAIRFQKMVDDINMDFSIPELMASLDPTSDYKQWSSTYDDSIESFGFMPLRQVESLQKAPCAPKTDIMEVIERLWALKAGSQSNDENPEDKNKTGVSLNSNVPGSSASGQRAHWSFMDNLKRHSTLLQGLFSTSGGTNTSLETISEKDESEFFLTSAQSIISSQLIDQNQNLDHNENTDAEMLNAILNPVEFIVYPLQPINHMVGSEVIFFVEQKPRQNFIKSWLFQVQLARPDGSVQYLVLLPDHNPLEKGRYFCSFYPTETGSHLLSITIDMSSDPNDPDTRHIQGSPVFINPFRSYSPSNSFGYYSTPIRAPFQMPFYSKAWGIAVYRPNNWIYLADRQVHKIFVLDASFNVINSFGGRGSGGGQLSRPTGVAVDRIYGRVIVTDKDNHRVSVFGLYGNFIFCFGKKGNLVGEFNYPWDVAVSPNGEVIAVADSMNHRIQLFDATGHFLRQFSIFAVRPFSAKEEFYTPRGISFNLEGSLMYVTDFSLHSVFVLNLELTMKETFIPSGPLSRPQGLTVDETGNVIIADSKNSCVRIVSPNGSLLCTMKGAGKDKFDGPLHVAVLRGGRVLVVDKENRLLIF